MTVFNFGSINVDYVYKVPHLVRPGETLRSNSLQTVLGGKGANQSVALARAGVKVKHIGRLGESDVWAQDLLVQSGVDAEFIEICQENSGHAIIQVDDSGENAIVLHGGANQNFSRNYLDEIIQSAQAEDFLLMQNEVNLVEHALTKALEQGMRVILNPAPMCDELKTLELHKLDTLIVNEIEAQMLSGEKEIDAIIAALTNRLPSTRIVITLGSKGALLIANAEQIFQAANVVQAVDTTGAGDTFVGYFLASLIQGLDERAALKRACHAAALAVTSVGAIPSIPQANDLLS